LGLFHLLRAPPLLSINLTEKIIERNELHLESGGPFCEWFAQGVDPGFHASQLSVNAFYPHTLHGPGIPSIHAASINFAGAWKIATCAGCITGVPTDIAC
jgi:hypothetical protein